MPTPIAVILNAASTAGDRGAIIGRISQRLRAEGYQPDILAVSAADVQEAAQRARDRGVELIAAGGGDGTVSAVAAVLVGSPAVLGVLPLGTLNHFAKDLGIPLDLDAALATLAQGQTTAVDVGDVNGRTFINNSSLGLYPRLVWEREKLRRQGRHRWPAFASAVAHVWTHFRRVRVTVACDGGRRVVRTPFVFVGNNEYQLAGPQMGGRATLRAGALHLCLAPETTRFGMLRVMLAALCGRLQDGDHFESLSTREMTVDSRRRRLGVALDGELAVLDSPLLYRVRPEVLRVRVPADAGAGAT